MRVLGVDPGTATTGYGVVALGSRTTLKHEAHGVITTPTNLSPEKRLALIYEGLTTIIREYEPDVVAIEELFFKNNITTGIKVAQARGIAMLAAAHAGLEVAHYKPAEVKQGIAGVGNATKEQIRYMTKVLLGLPDKPKPDDAADGLAIAICHLYRGRAQARLNAALS
ncbi:MAG: crossover junction endodeoxyribonuclease RuvC [Candidatus Poribacteria bacterium]|nr:crossover junction endodeoxyribonuclease RuvC [Candidatus Poribacteria bacterium]